MRSTSFENFPHTGERSEIKGLESYLTNDTLHLLLRLKCVICSRGSRRGTDVPLVRNHLPSPEEDKRAEAILKRAKFDISQGRNLGLDWAGQKPYIFFFTFIYLIIY